jgi:hypothetical protein
MEQTTTEPQAESAPDVTPDLPCPHCGEPAEKDQLVCLHCGGRIALDYRRPPGWKLPTAIVAGVALVAAAAFGWGLREITDNARTEVADSAPASKAVQRDLRRQAEQRRAAEARTAERRRTAASRRRAAARKRPAKAAPAAAANVPGTWPKGKNAFTVILVSVDNAGAAKAAAQSAKKSGVPAGYLRSNDYPSLQKGFWYVYGGVYKTRGRAEKAAAKFGGGFGGAYVQWVDGAKAGTKGKKKKR